MARRRRGGEGCSLGKPIKIGLKLKMKEGEFAPSGIHPLPHPFSILCFCAFASTTIQISKWTRLRNGGCGTAGVQLPKSQTAHKREGAATSPLHEDELLDFRDINDEDGGKPCKSNSRIIVQKISLLPTVLHKRQNKRRETA
jgi:hypothetical protein